MSEETISNQGGGDDWRAPLAALAGDKPEYKAAIESFKAPDELFARLTAQPEAPDWRKLLAGDNADRLKKLERFTDPKAFVESFEQKDAYINSGKKVTVPGENASAEEIALWNAARGVPEKADGYQITAKPPEGLEIDDANKGILTGIVGKLHSLGAEPAVVNAAHEIFYEQLQQAYTAQESALVEGPQRAGAELAKVWGNKAELEQNCKFAAAGAQQFLGPLDGEKAKAFLNIQTADGYYLGDHPIVVQSLAALGRANADDPLFLEASGAGGGQGSVNDQIEAIYALRYSNDPKVQKSYDAPETRQRLVTLLAARERQQGRSAA